MKNKFLPTAAVLMLSTLAYSQSKPVVVPANTKPVIAKKPVVLTAPNTIKKVDLENIDEWLCPKLLVKGDREFGGNGPRVKCEVKIFIGTDSASIWAQIWFWAQETVHDFSTTEGSWTKKIYDAPYGEQLVKIKSERASRVQFISPAAGFQFLFPGADVRSAMRKLFDGSLIADAVLAAHGLPPVAAAPSAAVNRLIDVTSEGGNTVVRVPANEGTLVKFFHIVGDTGGDDISTDDNCNDDTRIVKIEFFPVIVETKKIRK
jgi:hypothetical protein